MTNKNTVSSNCLITQTQTYTQAPFSFRAHCLPPPPLSQSLCGWLAAFVAATPRRSVISDRAAGQAVQDADEAHRSLEQAGEQLRSAHRRWRRCCTSMPISWNCSVCGRRLAWRPAPRSACRTAEHAGRACPLLDSDAAEPRSITRRAGLHAGAFSFVAGRWLFGLLISSSGFSSTLMARFSTISSPTAPAPCPASAMPRLASSMPPFQRHFPPRQPGAGSAIPSIQLNGQDQVLLASYPEGLATPAVCPDFLPTHLKPGHLKDPAFVNATALFSVLAWKRGNLPAKSTRPSAHHASTGEQRFG